MGIRKLKRFTKQFVIDGKAVDVDFHPVNTIEKQLYQIYVSVNEKPFRIHMQKSEEGRFQIAMKERVPKNILELESGFENAIIDS